MHLRLKDLREDKDLKQVDIANLLNCSQAAYSRYENGERDIPLEALNKLAEFYNVSVDFIMKRTDKEQ